MSVQSVMWLEIGNGKGIRCRFISEWFKMNSYVYTKENLLSEIGKNNPDVILFDLDLYAKIDGIKTAETIRSKYNIPILYVNHENLKQDKSFAT